MSYLNSKPLIEDLEHLASSADLTLDYPSRLADDLAAGELDVALIPSFEFLRQSDYKIVSDACVATHGAVMSVKLYTRTPWSEIRRLALDEGSRTSAALAQILLAERFGVHPELMPLPIGESAETSPADAVLMIGDRAMHPPQESFHDSWDLGEEWLRWTGLPFVFALWAARKDTQLDQVELALTQSRDRGVSRLPEIAQREADKLGLTEDVATRYLQENLYFQLGSAERSGLRLFQQLAIQNQFLTADTEIVFHNCRPSNSRSHHEHSHSDRPSADTQRQRTEIASR
ncbi:menaquinone biosynthetic enzyme MqnA/MqnD family protein [Thalassoroseus pseudoceratinae]|uniref:menaquinone biosynthetic enzyme MqnA/MqnD family protein n=1 Tax=Thalassoroseus pseudoceratinae TaxID=2713176 RepID=UPI001F0DA726|nr:menaquinone biosynthesis protein [Thalassoroseus pseudoceratinae]